MLWTGPAEDRKRYRVYADSSGPQPVGDGGEGLVFRAAIGTGEHERSVALKLLSTVRLNQFPALQSRSDAIRAVVHPNLMRQREVFVGTGLVPEDELAGSDVDVLYSVAEWVPGVPFPDAVAADDVHQALGWVAQIAEAVAALHAHRDAASPDGIVHRDVKPSNIRVTPDGRAMLIDFGIARPHDESEYTKASGTYGWRAPELLGGPGAPGPPIDVWGVGAVAYWVLVGTQPPLEEAAAARLRLTKALGAEFGPDATHLAAHVAALLESDPAKRPTDLIRWANQLRDFITGRARRRRRLRTSAIVFPAVLITAVLVLAGVGLAKRLLASPSPKVATVVDFRAFGDELGRSPTDLTLDARGNLYIADPDNKRVQKWSRSQMFEPATRAQRAQTLFDVSRNDVGTSSFEHVALDAKGNVYAIDTYKNRVRKWVPGVRRGFTVAGGNGRGDQPNQLDGPKGVAIDGAGNVYVSDTANHRVQKWEPGATKGVTVAGGNGKGDRPNQLSHPEGVALDAQGNLYIADNENHRVQKWAPGAERGVTFAYAKDRYPAEIAVDAQGNVYIAETIGARVQKWAPGSTEGVTVAGGNGEGYQSDKFGAAPSGVAVDATGNVYVADIENDRVQKWAPGSTEGVTVAGGNGEGDQSNQLTPGGVAVDASGNVYVADIENNRVQKWAPGAAAGITLSEAPNAFNIISGVDRLTLDARGNVYVTDSSNDRVQKWAPGASEGVTVAGGSFGDQANELKSPEGVAVDAKGHVYVADYLNGRVQKWVPGAGEGVTVAGGNGNGDQPNQLSQPEGVALDANGNLYIADTENHRVQKWAPGAKQGITVAGGHGPGNRSHQLNSPTGVVLDANGNLYIADTENNRVQKWGPGAKRGFTVAGGHGKGDRITQLRSPHAVALDGVGNLYVADSGNHRVQRWVL